MVWYGSIINYLNGVFEMKTITVRIKNVYGEDKVYPVSDEAILFACIAGTTTLTNSTINRIKQLGYSILVEQQTLEDTTPQEFTNNIMGQLHDMVNG
jgi:hypothetical protein